MLPLLDFSYYLFLTSFLTMRLYLTKDNGWIPRIREHFIYIMPILLVINLCSQFCRSPLFEFQVRGITTDVPYVPRALVATFRSRLLVLVFIYTNYKFYGFFTPSLSPSWLVIFFNVIIYQCMYHFICQMVRIEVWIPETRVWSI